MAALSTVMKSGDYHPVLDAYKMLCEHWYTLDDRN
jgi:hypothetical protein